MTGYTKVFNSIITSTIWQEDSDTKVVWVTLLALADKDGVADATIPGLANLAGVPLAKTIKAIKKFLAPDPYSRTKTDGGRRMIEVESGWLLLNHAAYREKGDPAARREQNRLAQQRFRAKNANSKQIVSNNNQRSAQAEAEAEAEAVNKELSKQRKPLVQFDYEVDEFVNITPKDIKKWGEAFPAVEINRELKSAGIWLRDNPTKRKTQVKRFLSNWFRRCQERGGSRNNSGSQHNGSSPKPGTGGATEQDYGNQESEFGQTIEV